MTSSVVKTEGALIIKPSSIDQRGSLPAVDPVFHRKAVDVYDLKASFLGSLMLPVPRGLGWKGLSSAPLTLHDDGLCVLAPTETEALELVHYTLSGLPGWAR